MEIFNSLLPHFQQLGMWGYWILLLIAFLDALVFIGIAVPGAATIVAAGFLSARGYLDIGDLIWFISIGTILGDSLSYYLGTKGTNFFHNENKLLKASHLDRGKSFFHQHGSKSVFLGRFVSVMRSIVPFVAGISSMPKRKFIFWDIIGAFIWSAAHLLAGYFFGNAFAVIELWSVRIWYIVGLIAIFLVIIYIIRFITVKKGKQVARFLLSLARSIWEAIVANPDVQNLIKRYPRWFAFLGSRTHRQSFFGLPLTLIAIGFAYVLLLFFGVVRSVLSSTAIVSADLPVTNLLAYFRGPELTKVFLWITLWGNWQIALSVTLIFSLIFWLWQKKYYLIYFWSALVGSTVLNYLGKIIVHRERPENPVYLEHSFSFPSGHAMTAVVLYGFITYVLIRHNRSWKRKVNIFFASLILILAIGFSRLYLGVHYLSDVWGGYLLGLLVLTTATSIYEWQRSRQANPENEQVFISQKIKIITVILLLVNIIFASGFAWQYQPEFVKAPQLPTQFIGSDIGKYFDDYKISKYSETLSGNPQEPLGFIFLARNDEAVIKSFQAAGWFLADQVTISSVAQTAGVALFNKQYLQAPMTPSFWNATVNKFGFQKPTEANTVRRRHHIRVWKTDWQQGNLSVYVATASLDVGIKWLVTHKIDPDIDTEKTFVKDSLVAAGTVTSLQEIKFVAPVLGTNFSNDQFFTNGQLYIIYLK